MKIMASWMTLDELEGSNIKYNYKGRDGHPLVKMSTYWKLFGFHFCYRRQVDKHISRVYSPISLGRVWSTEFWKDYKFCTVPCHGGGEHSTSIQELPKWRKYYARFIFSEAVSNKLHGKYYCNKSW